ncbi:MAG TPA: hypothetical protein VGZ22_00865 [Isosphaeraceae bacterium]|jgi:hypothetical protein|nr:hypothetical protein [Isosphaeraceae bacterium]
MGFLEALSRVLGHHRENEGADYDRAQWRKRLSRLLEQLPQSQGEWEPLMAEARALGLDPAWVKASEREAFSLLIRRVVADRVVTGMEHRKLDLARDLIGIPDAEAEAILHAIVAEAEQLFGKPVEGA